jgi:hypothetical protein
MNTQPTGQLEQATAALMAISPNVTVQDKKEAFTTFSPFTISQYLNGKGKRLDTAMALLKLFKGRIEERNKELQEVQDMNGNR